MNADPPRPDPSQGEVTRLLAQLEQGQHDAAVELFPIVYEELKSLADHYLSQERRSHTLQPTALVHEAFLKLVGQKDARFASRGHFFAVAATAMRRVLVRHAERRGAQKRGGARARVELDEAGEVLASATPDGLDLLALDQALTRLADLDARKVQVVEMRYFGGLSVEETALALKSSPATVKRDWEFARVWLLRELTRDR